jgi:predicted dehydrogenase
VSPHIKRALIIGAGRIAGLNEREADRRKPCTHAGALMSPGDIALSGVVDQDIARACEFARLFSIPYSGNDIEIALSEVKPNLVTVAVPYWLQHDVVMAIASSAHRPKKILLEKPLADSLERAEAIIGSCRRAGISVLVNNECAAPVFEQMKIILKEDLRDEVISVSAWCSSGMHAVGIHMLGILRYLFGRVVWVRAVAETEPVKSLPFSTNFTPDDPRIHAMLMFESGVSCFLTNSALMQYTCKEVEVTCRSGRLRLSDNGNLLQLWRPAAPGTSTVSYRLATPESVPIDRGTVFSRIGQFLSSDDLDAGSDTLGGDIALETYRTLDALIRSARDRKDIILREAA